MEEYQKLISRFKRGIPMGIGTVVTVRPRANLDFGQYSVLNNIRKWYPGLEKRRGMGKFHSDEIQDTVIQELTFTMALGTDENIEYDLLGEAGTWTNARDKAVCDNVFDDQTTVEARTDFDSGPLYDIERGLLAWEISSGKDPARTVLSAAIDLIARNPIFAPADPDAVGCITLSGKAWDTGSSAVTSDFARANNIDLGLASDDLIAQDGRAMGTPYTFDLNAAGIAVLQNLIDDTDTRDYADFWIINHNFDFSNVDQAPDTSSHDNDYEGITGTPAQHPKLRITVQGPA